MGRPDAVLVATDFSEEALWARDRAALLAPAAGFSRGVLMHVQSPLLPAGLEERARQGALRELARHADDPRAAGRLALEPRLAFGRAHEQLAEAAKDFAAVVAGAKGEHFLVELALGRTSQRLARRCPVPLLVVKREARAAYASVVAAVDFTPLCREAALLAARWAPQARLHLVHAYEVEFESALRLGGIDDAQLREYRERAADEARFAMQRFAAELAIEPQRLSTSVGHGHPLHVIGQAEARLGPDLLVAGRHTGDRLKSLVMGSTALEALQRSACDVLIVPGD